MKSVNQVIKPIGNFIKKVFLGGAIVSATIASSLPATAGEVVSRVYQLQLATTVNGQAYCIDIDISKVDRYRGADNAKVSPCRNIREQRFVLQSASNGVFRFQTESDVNNLNQCLGTNATKVGVVNGAQNTHVEQCRDIQEINHNLSHLGNNNYTLVLQGKSANGSQLCQAVDLTKIGVYQEANQVKAEPCRPIREMA